MTRSEAERLVERLILMADQGDYGRKPDPTDVRRRAATLITTLTQRVEELERALEWQPIETFAEPTGLSSGDGVLIAEKDGTVGEAYCRNFGDADDGWWWANTSWGDYPTPDRPIPTHWRPLPEPPALVALSNNHKEKKG